MVRHLGIKDLGLSPPAPGLAAQCSTQALPLCGGGSCAAPPVAFSLVRSHARAHRRLWLGGSSSCLLLALSEACRDHLRHRLAMGGELLGTTLATFDQLREPGLGFMDRPALHGSQRHP